MNIMKKILSMLVFALPLVLFSCSKDEPQATNNNQSVPAVEEDEITYFMCAAQAKAWQGKDTVAVLCLVDGIPQRHRQPQVYH